MTNKKLLTGILIGFTVLVSCESVPIKGNGNLVSSEKAVSSFEKIHINDNAQVRFHVSQEYRVVVTVDSNLEEYTRIFLRENVLSTGTVHGHFRFTKYLVDVYCPALIGVSISGSGQFSCEETLIASTFDTHVSGSGKLELTIECDIFTAKIPGSGKITVNGSSKDSSIEVRGSGKFSGDKFTANNADVLITGSGTVNIGVTDNLNAKITGSGRLYYRGKPPVLEASVSRSGRIRKL